MSNAVSGCIMHIFHIKSQNKAYLQKEEKSINLFSTRLPIKEPHCALNGLGSPYDDVVKIADPK